MCKALCVSYIVISFKFNNIPERERERDNFHFHLTEETQEKAKLEFRARLVNARVYTYKPFAIPPP